MFHLHVCRVFSSFKQNKTSPDCQDVPVITEIILSEVRPLKHPALIGRAKVLGAERSSLAHPISWDAAPGMRVQLCRSDPLLLVTWESWSWLCWGLHSLSSL